MKNERPPLDVPRTAGTLDRALALVRLLRENCPWDAEQTARSLVPHLLEETHEVVDAIHDDDFAALEDELGDLLLNLAFQIVVAEESGALTAQSVTDGLVAKMVRRHPHLFSGGEREGWEAVKARERRSGSERTESNPPVDVDRARDGVLSGLPKGLDPLTRAHRVQERVAGIGFDWSDHRGALEKVEEELEEVRSELDESAPVTPWDGEHARAPRTEDDRARNADALEEELGDLMFAAVNLVRLAGHHPNTALARANRKFEERFARLEALAEARGIALEEAGLAVLDELWDEIKREGG